MPAAHERALTQQESNEWVVGIAGAVVGLTAAGALADWGLRRFAERRLAGKPALGLLGGGLRVWALVLLLCSYGMLAPGLLMNLVQADVSFNIFGHEMPLTSLSEGMLALIGRMRRQGNYTGVVLVSAYAIAIPAVKLLLVLAGLWLQLLGGEGRLRWARRCLVAVRLISRWACPDMFAYILMTYLFRSLNKPPTLQSDLRLGPGFACFCVFCVGSTVSSLGLRLPEVPPKEGATADAPRAVPARWRCAGNAAVLALAAAFLALLAVGLAMPVMGLRFDLETLYEARPQLRALAPILDMLHLPELLRSEASVWECMAALARWLAEGDATCGIALVMYAVFAVALPVAHVATLVASVCSRRARGPALAAAAVIGKLCMLDVSIMGAVVVSCAMSNLREKGVVVAVGRGLFVLLGAEVCRYALAIAAPALAGARAARGAPGAPGAAAPGADAPAADVEKADSANEGAADAASRSEASESTRAADSDAAAP